MGKLSGVLFILGGCMGLLWSWYHAEKKRQEVVEDFIRLFAQWEYSLKRAHMRLYDFLESHACEKEEVEAFAAELLAGLMSLEHRSGSALWRQTLDARRKSLGLRGGLWEILVTADKAFFGRDMEECLRCAAAVRARMEECLGAERAEFCRKWKVYLPVGMMGGVLLIIILI